MNHRRVLYLSGLGLLLAFSFLSVFFFYSAPTRDGDVYFHLEYGRQVVENHNPVIDEDMYRWGEHPEINIYPAWVAQAIFYIAWKYMGLFGVYLVRFLFLGIIAALSLWWVKRLGIKDWFVPITALLIMLELAQTACMLKADLFTGLFFFLFVFLYFYIRQTGRKKMVFLFPVIALLWANSHISVILGLGFLFLCLVVEFVFFRRDKIYGHFFIALLLSSLALFLTPQPLYYFKVLKGTVLHILKLSSVGGEKNVVENNLMAYQRMHISLSNFYLWVLFVMSGIYLMMLTRYVNRRIGDRFNLRCFIRSFPWWHLFLVLPFLRFFFLFSRMGYFIGPVLFFLILWLMKEVDFPEGTTNLFLFLFRAVLILFAGGCMYNAMFVNTNNEILKHGVWVPQREALFVQKCLPSHIRMFNSYSAGSYFMWKMHGKNQVFIDSRTGTQFEEYIGFLKDFELEGHLDALDFDVAFISYKEIRMLRQFADMKDFEMVFWGDAGVVFVRKKIEKDICRENKEIFKSEFSGRISNNKYLDRMFIFFVYAGKLDVAKQIYDIVSGGEGKEDWDFVLKAEESVLPAKAYLAGHNRLVLFPPSFKATLLGLWRKREALALSSGDIAGAMMYEDLCAYLESDKFRWRHLFNCGVINLKGYHLLKDKGYLRAGKAYISSLLDYCEHDGKGHCRKSVVTRAENILDDREENLDILRR